MNSAPAVIDRPFPSVYRQFQDAPERDVKRAIEQIIGAGMSVTMPRVREILTTTAKPGQPAPYAVAVPANEQLNRPFDLPLRPLPIIGTATNEQIEARHIERVAASVTAHAKVVSLAGKLAACANHTGLSAKEEADFQRNRRRFPHMGYLPEFNAYDTDAPCMCHVPARYSVQYEGVCE